MLELKREISPRTEKFARADLNGNVDFMESTRNRAASLSGTVSPASSAPSSPDNVPLKVVRSRSFNEMDQVTKQEANSYFEKNVVVCRICEEEISLNLLKEHSKFCVIANRWDMIAAADDENLYKVAKTLNDKIMEVMQQEDEEIEQKNNNNNNGN
jgi:hypothetical protein